MARPHTEFLQAQWLPWDATPLLAHLKGVSHRVLSRDAQTGALTALLRFPAGWVAHDAPPCALDEELYTLSGAVSVNGVFLPDDFYARLPAGFPRHRMTAPQETVALAFYTPGKAVPDDFDHDRWVPRTDVYLSIWPAAEPQHGLDLAAHHARARVLATEPDSGAQTMAVGWPPVWYAATAETQTVDAEYYLLAGECMLDGRGTMKPGAYIWRPAGTTRPPMAARTASVFLVRSHGGPLAFAPGTRGTVDLAGTPDCVLPADVAARLTAGPYAKEPA